MALPLQLARWVPAVALGLAVAFGASAAHATIKVTFNERSISTRDKDQKPTWVSHKDCVDQNNLKFTLSLPAGALSYQLEVWANIAGNTDCTESTQRGNTGTCWQVYSKTPNSISLPVEIAARDIAGKHSPGTTGGGGPGSGTLADCDSSAFAATGTAITLYFMLVQATGAQATDSASFTNTGIDLIGPDAPTSASAGAGDGELVVSWTPVSGVPYNGYRFYCFPTPGSTGDASAALEAGVGGSAGTPGTGGAAGMPGTGGASGTAGSAAAGSSGGGAGGSTTIDGGTPTDGGSDAGTATECYPGSPLKAGELPDETYYCGSGTGNTVTNGTVKGLDNGTEYAVAVALVDEVGNVGKLSSDGCAIPKAVDGFFDQYRKAGGQGGGGFCDITGSPAPGAGLAFAAALAATLMRRRRRAR